MRAYSEAYSGAKLTRSFSQTALSVLILQNRRVWRSFFIGDKRKWSVWPVKEEEGRCCGKDVARPHRRNKGEHGVKGLRPPIGESDVRVPCLRRTKQPPLPRNFQDWLSKVLEVYQNRVA